MVIATRLLDRAKRCGFAFWRAGAGEDGPLVGYRVTGSWVDVIHIAGFSRDCLAVRQRTSSLILHTAESADRRVEGSALDVLNEVLAWEPSP